MGAYPIPPEKWEDSEIVIGQNPLTGKEEGDDSGKEGVHGGYRKVPRLQDNLEPLVVPAVATAAVYDGYNEYGAPKNEAEVLKGGLEGGVLVVRETLARTMEYLNEIYKKYTEYELLALDGFRSRSRQAAGWDRLRKRIMAEQNIGESTPSEIYTASLAADDIFSVVNPDTNSKEYQELDRELRADAKFIEEVRHIVSTKYDDGEVTEARVDDLIFEYIAFIANADIAQAQGRKVPLDADMMAHNSADAIDFMLRNRKTGALVSPVGFDFPNRPGAAIKLTRMDSVEHPNAYEAYRDEALANPGYAAHLKSMGMDPQNFTRADFEKLKKAQRVWFHSTQAVGMSNYVNETWHANGGINPRKIDGSLLLQNPTYWENRNVWGGNTCDAHLKLGPTGIAAFGGNTAEIIARRDWGLTA